MNVLNNALNAVSFLQKTITTTIYNRVYEVVDGIAKNTIEEVTARVHAQPLTMKELEQFSKLEKSSTMLKFYIMGDKAEIVDFFKSPKSSNAIIKWDGGEYSIYGKISWQNSLWIKVYGILNNESNN